MTRADGPTPASTVKRHPERASYDAATIHEILDAGFVGHFGFVVDEQPFVIPVVYGRDGDHVLLHGSVASRAMRTASTAVRCCLTVTHVDGIVFARSAFHHSLNYRSVVILGVADRIDDPTEKSRVLMGMLDHLAPGRADDVRAPNDSELRQTMVLRLSLAEASAKIRTGPPVDEPDDLALAVWAGVVPTPQVWGEPQPDGAGVAVDAPNYLGR